MQLRTLLRWSGVLRSMVVVVVISCVSLQAQATSWRMESGDVTLPATEAGSSFLAVPFRQAYTEAPLVFVLSSSVDGEPVAVRVRNVTASGFECVQVEPSGDGPHGEVVVH
ncbi:MAG: hypothetical protein GXP47_03650, partial [Acidobacteria bacterium]|nr:hypothetical protein [Acidobacteriota bacterium]